MPAMDTGLFNDPEVKGLALAILEECVDLREFGRRMLELVANAAMSARADEECGAAYGERSPSGRTPATATAAGLATSVGDVTLRIPKLRSGSFFPDDLIERYCRVDRALVAAVAEMYVMGVSTRKVEAVAGELGVSSMSKSQASRLCEVLDAEVAAFRRQRFDGVRFAYLWLDATYVKCRVEGRSVSQAVVTAIGLDDTGQTASWAWTASTRRAARLEGVPVRPARTRRRGREARRLGRARRAQGGGEAETFQGAAWQRCVTHLMRNVAGRICKRKETSAAPARP